MPATTIPLLTPATTKSKRKRDSSPDYLDADNVDEDQPPPKRKPLNLKIEIPQVTFIPLPPQDDDDDLSSNSSLPSILSEPDSLFDEDDIAPKSPPSETQPSIDVAPTPALVTAPPIPGLFFDPTLLLPQELADSTMIFCLDTYFVDKAANQVMLFGRPPVIADDLSSTPVDANVGLPSKLVDLLDFLSAFLQPSLPKETYELLFPKEPTCSRQAIINLYHPGEGISPHVDLLKRYGDGIIGVSFGSSCVMQFAKVDSSGGDDKSDREQWGLYLPGRSVIVLSEEARYQWTHGIERKTLDYVVSGDPQATVDQGEGGDGFAVANGQWKERGVRVSITFRWMLPGADVVGCKGA
ncbi:hypothetical protein BDN72DRAFT_796560 [Pluteus cervinus]|uniref:Uncharacterized protein n=1 Tax=Pluteus cervinus TaxID=181527 RepID=A0ACD3AUY5_9AGAR|nr:hypothetical protein BDN72DRAFT_796560 [Pluteus cervinus]